MFTGIIEEVGAIKQITHGQHSEVLNIQARTVLENTKIGDSIAVNGICPLPGFLQTAFLPMLCMKP